MPVEASDYYDIVKVESPAVSPSGDDVAFVRKTPRSDDEYEQTIHIVSDSNDKRFTLAGNTDTEPSWSPSADRLAFVSDRTGSPQIWILPTDGGEGKQVTDVIGDVSSIRWSPDGKRLAFVQQTTPKERDKEYDLVVDEEYEREDPDPRVIQRLVYRAQREYKDGRRSHIYTVDMDDGEGAVTRITEGEYDFENPQWGDSETLYYTVKRTGTPDDNLIHDLVRHNLNADESETVIQTTGWLPTFDVNDGGQIAYRHSDNEEPGPSMHKTNIKVYDPETEETTTPTAGFERRVYRGCTPQWGPDDNIYFLYPDQGEVNLARVSIGGENPDTLISTGGHIHEVDVTDNGIGFIQSNWNFPNDVYIGDFDGEYTRLTRMNDDYLQNISIPEPEEVWFESNDGTKIQGWILTPPNATPESRDSEKPFPLVVEIHGGPSIMWTTSGTMWHEFQLLATNGYAVFWCNPRGSTGYGEEHSLAIAEQWGTVDFKDIMAGVDTVTKRSEIDEDEVFVTGGSYGGFMTAWAVGHTDRFDAAVSQRGVYDQIAQFGATDTYHSNEKQLGLPWEEFEKYWESSPVAYVEDATTPTLIMHSERDFRVPVHNADVLYRFLKKTGTEVEYVRYPREGHELSRSGEPQHVVDRLDRTVGWFDEH